MFVCLFFFNKRNHIIGTSIDKNDNAHEELETLCVCAKMTGLVQDNGLIIRGVLVKIDHVPREVMSELMKLERRGVIMKRQTSKARLVGGPMSAVDEVMPIALILQTS